MLADTRDVIAKPLVAIPDLPSETASCVYSIADDYDFPGQGLGGY